VTTRALSRSEIKNFWKLVNFQRNQAARKEVL